MELNRLKSVFNKFDVAHEINSFRELKSGHINDTYLVTTTNNVSYILQKINRHVFKNVKGLVANKVLISNHLRSFYSKSDYNLNQKVLSFVPLKNKEEYYLEDQKDFWNLMYYIKDSKTFISVNNKKIAFEAGKLLGDFLEKTSNFNASELFEVLPNFHHMNFRINGFNSALKQASEDRLINAKPFILLVEKLKEEMLILQHLKDSKKIPIRVTHNDTKISNSLFDKNNKGICMIDTDTVMPGIVHFDFGDAIRTICNTANEDESDLSKVDFNLDFYNAYKKGFLEATKNVLTAAEITYLPLAVKTMIFIMGLRFLTDYLNNDVYYKIGYPAHNLVRAKNQFKLLEIAMQKLNI